MDKEVFSKNIFEILCSEIANVESLEKLNRKFFSVEKWLNWSYKSNRIKQDVYAKSISKIRKLKEDKERELIYNTERKNYQLPEIKTSNTLKIGKVILIFLLITSSYFFLKNFYKNDNKAIDVQTDSIYFSGLLTNETGEPITSKTDVYFRLYETAQGGNSIYTGRCIGEEGITPDHAGKFNIRLGQNCKMNKIPKSIFETKSTVYLGVQIGSNPELSPRQPISTVGYSRDSAHLNGRSVGSSTSNILYLDEMGNLAITAESPAIKSTNGIFTIEGESLQLRTTGKNNNSINIQPGPGGNTVISTGNFGIGIFEPTNLLSVFGNEPGRATISFTNSSIEDDKNTSVLDLKLGVEEGIESNFIRFFSDSTTKSTRQGNTEDLKSIGSIRQNKNGVVYETSGADFAEYFHIRDQKEVGVGKVISITNRGVSLARAGETVIGVVSDTAGFIGNKKVEGDNVLVALQGQIDVYVSTINGSLSLGDAVTSSEILGYGARENIDKKNTFGYIIDINKNKLENNLCPPEFKSSLDTNGNRIFCGKARIILK